MISLAFDFERHWSHAVRPLALPILMATSWASRRGSRRPVQQGRWSRRRDEATCEHGHSGCPAPLNGVALGRIMLDFVENLSERLLAQQLIPERELTDLKVARKRHIEDPETLIVSHLFFQAWGRKPGSRP